MAEQQLIGALEAGGTKMVCATGYADGTVLEREQIATTTPQETVEAVNAWFANKGIAALGIGAFGPTAVNPASPQYGKILETPKTAWRYFDLLGTIQNELNIPCGYDTDVNVACLGEVTFGCAQGLTDVVYLTIGTGVGAGVLSGGQLVHGMMHPEAGHILVTRDPRDTIGEHSGCPFHDNCLEGLIAGPGIKKRWDGKSAGDMDDAESNDSFRFQAFKRSFEGVTGSIGLAYEILPDFNLYQVFNMGHRMEIYVRPEVAEKVIAISKSFNIDAQIVGHIEEGKRSLTIKSEFGTFEY